MPPSVELIKPIRVPPWRSDTVSLCGDPDDLAAVEIIGLQRLENAACFEAMATDQRGDALRIVTSDSRVFAAHKLWRSKRADRDPLERQHDAEQAKVVAALVVGALPHLPTLADDLRMVPKPVFDDAASLFSAPIDDGVNV